MSAEGFIPENSEPDRSLVVKPATYEVTDDLPKPNVILLFEGLLWFIFHSKDECQVGIHNTTHVSTPHQHRHDLEIKIWEIESGCGTAQKKCRRTHRYLIGNPRSIAGLQIDVNRPTKKGVFVFQKDVGTPPTKHDNDWRWVIDFEREPLYPTGIHLHEPKISPAISINHAVFYTLHRTSSEFELVPDDGDPKFLGSTALLVGGNICLDEDGDVTLTIRRNFPSKPKVITLGWSKDKCYQIDLRNICMAHGKRCKPEVWQDTENDFYLYNETFTKPFDAPLYTLHKRTDKPAFETPKHICFDKNDEYFLRSSNEAPCGAVIAGGGGGG